MAPDGNFDKDSCRGLSVEVNKHSVMILLSYEHERFYKFTGDDDEEDDDDDLLGFIGTFKSKSHIRLAG